MAVGNHPAAERLQAVGHPGTTYLVRRRLVAAATLRPGEDEFVFIGARGKKAFVDVTPLAGAAHAEYAVQGRRGGRVGKVSDIYTMHIAAITPRIADMSAA